MNTPTVYILYGIQYLYFTFLQFRWIAQVDIMEVNALKNAIV